MSGTLLMQLRRLPANNAWVFLFGSTLASANILPMDGQRIFQTRDGAVAAAQVHGLTVLESGEVQ